MLRDESFEIIGAPLPKCVDSRLDDVRGLARLRGVALGTRHFSLPLACAQLTVATRSSETHRWQVAVVADRTSVIELHRAQEFLPRRFAVADTLRAV